MTNHLLIAALAVSSGLACTDGPVSVRGVPTRGDLAPNEFLIVYNTKTRQASITQGNGSALTEVGPEVLVSFVGVGAGATCGITNGVCIDVTLTSTYTDKQLDTTHSELYYLSPGSVIANSDSGVAGVDYSIGAWDYGTLRPELECAGATNQSTRRWVISYSNGTPATVALAGRVVANISDVTPTTCTGTACDCDACNCTQTCSDKTCDASCTNGSTCVIDVTGGNNATLACSDSLCTFSCTGIKNCTATCDGTSTCSAECEDLNNCDQSCSDTASCDFDCTDANNCVYGCDTDATCDIACSGQNECSTTCSDNSSCDITCSESNLCELSCAASADCVLRCTGGANCSVDCVGRSQVNCPGFTDVYACDVSDCPPSP